MTSLFELDYSTLAARLAALGEPPYRAKQIWNWVYVRLVDSFEAMSDLPRPLRQRLAGEFRLGALTPAAEAVSRTGSTRKLLFELADGQRVESVLMRYAGRRTACISTQAGCAMGCVFCATGQMGFRRNLSVAEILEQALWFARELQRQGDRLTNVVVMGMGEPFHNYAATLGALDRLTDPEGFNFGERRITISTVGLAPMLRRFAGEKRQINLAVSLHAATDDLRSRLVPINKKYPLGVLLSACRAYVQATGRRLSFEWALIRDVNDTPEQARALARLIEGMPAHVNVIPLNPTRDYAGAAATRERAARFKGSLEAAGIPCTIRVRRGIDISAGCGQLAVHSQRDFQS